MPKSGPDFYDEAAVFARYQAKRSGSENPNETLEKPVFDELAADLRDLRILDLGCGDARFGQEALQQGCRRYVGIEASQKMFRLAQSNLEGSTGTVIRATIEAWEYPLQHFDLVTSRLALHYVEDVTGVFLNVHNALIAGGRFIFSVEHPVITSCERGRRVGHKRQDWIVDDYFDSGRRVVPWMGHEVVKYHRTLEDYFIALRTAGFTVEALRESRPRRALFADEQTYRRRMRIPLMLFFLARRPPA